MDPNQIASEGSNSGTASKAAVCKKHQGLSNHSSEDEIKC